MMYGGRQWDSVKNQTRSWLKLVFSTVSEFLHFLISFFSFNIFLFLELLEIVDGADRPRDGIRRGVLWAVVAFQLSNAPIQLVNELERMSRGMAIKKISSMKNN